VQFYSSANSPFGARVVIAARAKGIGLETKPLPVGGLRSDEFLALNPIAKIPVLVTDTGGILVESGVILDYLEDFAPRPSLLPADPADRARIRLVCALVDRYVMDPVIRLFPHLDPARRDSRVVESEAARWRDGLSYLAHFIGKGLPAAEAAVSLADCVLAPSLHLGTRIAAMIGLDGDPMLAQPAIHALYRAAREHPLTGPVLRELTEAQALKDAAAGLPSLAHLH